jgi:hypothetical protein
MTQKHIIKKQILDLTLDSPVGSFTFQSEVGTLYRKEIVPLIDQYCSAIATDDGIIRIEQLEIDLGRIDIQHFGRDFKCKFAQVLPQKLTEALQMSSNRDLSEDETRLDRFCTEADRDWAVLEFFLDEGCLPWWVSSDESYEMPVLLEQNIATQPAKVKKLISGIIGNAALVKRLVYHADDRVLAQIIALFQPEQEQAISQLAQALLVGLAACPLLQSSGVAKLRPEVWEIILLQSVALEGSAFNRQLAFETTVKQLATIFGVAESVLDNQLAKAGGDALNALMLTAETAKHQAAKFKTGASWRQLETIAQLCKAFPMVLMNEVLPQQLAELESFLAKLRLTPDVAVNQKMVQADQKISKKIGQALAAIPQSNQRTAELQLTEDTGRLAQYARQLEIVAKLLSKISVGTELKAIAGNLAQLLQTIRDTAQLLDGLLNQGENAGSPSATLVGRLAKQIEVFEAALFRLRQDLASVTEQGDLTARHELLQSISRSIGTGEKIGAQSVPPDGLVSADPFSASAEIYVGNAGLVLLWPYLSPFFGALGLVSVNRFIDDSAAERAALLLHYLAGGTKKVREYELTLNKIICGINAVAPVKPYLEITETEQVECENLLKAVIRNWPAIKNVSILGLRSLFLHREGLIFNRDDQMVLRIAGAAYDILVDQIPWGISTVKLPWMKQLLMVEWRI